MSGAFRITDQPCPGCAADGYDEPLYSNGVLTLCSIAYCAFRGVPVREVPDVPPWTQLPLL